MNALEHTQSFCLVATLATFLVSATSCPLDSFFAVLVDYAETDNLIAIIHEFVDEPFQRSVRVFIGVCAAEESA